MPALADDAEVGVAVADEVHLRDIRDAVDDAAQRDPLLLLQGVPVGPGASASKYLLLKAPPLLLLLLLSFPQLLLRLLPLRRRGGVRTWAKPSRLPALGGDLAGVRVRTTRSGAVLRQDPK